MPELAIRLPAPYAKAVVDAMPPLELDRCLTEILAQCLGSPEVERSACHGQDASIRRMVVCYRQEAVCIDCDNRIEGRT